LSRTRVSFFLFLLMKDIVNLLIQYMFHLCACSNLKIVSCTYFFFFFFSHLTVISPFAESIFKQFAVSWTSSFKGCIITLYNLFCSYNCLRLKLTSEEGLTRTFTTTLK
jgi:hypothetical protein